MAAGPEGEAGAGRWPERLALVAIACWLLWAFTLIPYSHGDEGNSLAEGLRWFRDGELIHRDYFEFLPPLSFALTGALQLAFGPGLLAARLATWAMLLFSAWAMMRLARLAGAGPWGACLAGLGLVALLHPLFPGYSHHWLALALGLGAVQLVLREAANAPSGLGRHWAGAGFLACATGLSLQSDGAALVLALALWAAWWAWAQGEGWAGWGRRALAFGGGLLALALPTLAFFAGQGALGQALELWALWPLRHYGVGGGMNDAAWAMDLQAYLGTNGAWLNRPSWYAKAFMALGLVALGPGLLLAALAWAPRAWRPRPSAADGALALLLLWAALQWALALKGKADLPHLAVYAAPALVAAAALTGRWAARFRAPGEGLLAQAPALVLGLWVLAGAQAQLALMKLEPWRQPHWAGGPDAWWLAQPLVQALRALPPGAKLAAYPYGGHFYVYGPRPAVGIHMFMPPSARFHSPDEAAGFWHDVAQKRPYLLFAPYLSGQPPWASYQVAAPEGYATAGVYPSPQYPGLKAWLYAPRAEGAR